MIKMPSGECRSIKFDGVGTISLGKFGSFPAAELVGQLYGLRYDIAEKTLKVIAPPSIEDVEDTDATNELIRDSSSIQEVTYQEIEQLKSAGVLPEEIINKQIESHASFALKTEYSKDKYKKRKQAKFLKHFSTIEPTIHNVCDYWFKKDQSRIRDIRPDALSQMMTLANVHPGGRYLVADDVSGLLIACMLERLGGEGRVMNICDVESPPVYHIVSYMNFEPQMVDNVLVSLNWATADEMHEPILAATEPMDGQKSSDGQRIRMQKRKLAESALFETREELFRGNFDGILIASQYEPYSVTERLIPYLAGSGSIVIHSPYIQVLTEAQSKMRADPKYLAPSIAQPWLRQYQACILPGRTHPMMNTSGSGGFLLSATRM
ncbi:Gcd10p-domain-containing protein [Sistotremastrum suecicum HHB10207 ss-3]|uniref:tRNA (adenine(58)-N(1))-methyltransferase non-catalytic subunit TRM6 n=1 Tax=Sistotremastrum suecicum HHB10207 ss-3 TaxID=1314776 RepID=A0A166IL29_9AGAM|nr:Gcd10p-domain-containing protein [Sistotremastrum suecicum HHB10207 ss-3]